MNNLIPNFTSIKVSLGTNSSYRVGQFELLAHESKSEIKLATYQYRYVI